MLIHLIVTGCAVAYIFIGGVIYGLAYNYTEANKEDSQFYGAGWPITLVCWIIYLIATAGPRLVTWAKTKKQETSLPKMRVVK